MSLVAAYMLNRLKEWGVHRVYGYPGDGINGFLGAFEEVEEPARTAGPVAAAGAAALVAGRWVTSGRPGWRA